MSAWSLVYEGYDPASETLRETLCTLGNGYFATRGASTDRSFVRPGAIAEIPPTKIAIDATGANPQSA